MDTVIHKEIPVMPDGYSYLRELFHYKRIDHLLMLLEFIKDNIIFEENFYF